MLNRLKRAAHTVDHALGRRGTRCQVLAELRTGVSQAVLAPVYESLARTIEIDLWFTSDDPSRVLPLVEPRRFLTHAQAEWRRFDLYLNSDPWGAARLRRCARRVNFFHGVAGKYDLDDPSGLPLGFEIYDRVAFVNRDRMARYLSKGIVREHQARLVGYPKLDRLVSGALDGGDIRRRFGIEPGLPLVAYAPTFSPSSSLHSGGEALVAALADAGFAVVVKLHDRSLIPDDKYTAGIDWRSRMQRLERPGRVRLVDVPDASEVLAAADLLVTDHSSIGFEYLVLDRPLVVFDAPQLVAAARINEEKVRLLRSAARVVRDVDELPPACAEELRFPRALSPARRAVAEEIFYRPGGATARAVDMLLELLRTTTRTGVAAAMEGA